jgi:hypothetical protein
MQKLLDLLTPDVVCDLTDVEVQRIAGESNESAAERLSATDKLRVLESGIAELKRLKRHNLERPGISTTKKAGKKDRKAVSGL